MTAGQAFSNTISPVMPAATMIDLPNPEGSARDLAPARPDNSRGCVELLGGNELRTDAVVLPGLELLLIARPAGSPAGGDLYCLHSCGGHTLAKIVLLDISGHGQRSALVAHAIHPLLHRFSRETEPGRFLDLVNRQFAEFSPHGFLATSLCAVYDSRRGELRYANGGQPRILIWQATNRHWTTLMPAQQSDCGLPLGVTATACYEEESVLLHPGDMLLVFSDGVIETRNAAGEFLGPGGVERLAQDCTDETGAASPLAALGRAFLRRLEQCRGGLDFQDNITLLWARPLPAERLAGASAEPG